MARQRTRPPGDGAADGPPAEAHPDEPAWSHWPDDRLLGLRFRDLGVSIEGTVLEDRIARVHQEMDAKGLIFRPHYWLSSEWFTPDGIPGIAIPFYLAHPRLVQLERSHMLEVEGGDPEWCLRILRHEVGHAIDNAYRLRRRRRRQKLFRKSSQPYPDYYTPRPYSKSYVMNLDMWYAQSHPDEDFAETFAVWLEPNVDWRARYAGWPALRKIEYMDELMREIAGREPLVQSNQRVDPLPRLRRTLRAHYKEKLDLYGADHPSIFDRDLRKLFSGSSEYADQPTAAAFLSRIRKEARGKVRHWTGVYQYTIDRILADIISRCRELGLRLCGPEEQTKTDFIILLTVQTMSYLHNGRHRIAL